MWLSAWSGNAMVSFLSRAKKPNAAPIPCPMAHGWWHWHHHRRCYQETPPPNTQANRKTPAKHISYYYCLMCEQSFNVVRWTAMQIVFCASTHPPTDPPTFFAKNSYHHFPIQRFPSQNLAITFTSKPFLIFFKVETRSRQPYVRNQNLDRAAVSN